ncbi:MAG: DUF1624 domain-containing protein [Bacteroidetes bacterium]|nr:DUF1624 domain-containing protein [Bacteroidota bacterium]
MIAFQQNRITSIDFLKGLVMVVMALDHTRDYFHASAFIYNPSDPLQTTIPIFLTRFITHFCAPIFSLLAGISAFMVGKRKPVNELSAFLFKRGLWLVIIELTIVNFAWCFDIYFRMNGVAVIWSLGISMIVLAALVRLPAKAILLFSCVVIFGHNLLDTIHFPGNIWWSLLHEPAVFKPWSNYSFSVDYPIIPWVGVMSLGYCLGPLFDSTVAAEKRKKILRNTGIASFMLFLIVRGINNYGDTEPWVKYDTLTQTLFSFFNPDKYPPSLDYLLLTLGPAFIFLAYAEKIKGTAVNFFTIFGRVPFFYYIIHLFAIHALAMLTAQLTGFGWRSMVLDLWLTENPALKDYGFPLIVVYAVWIVVIVSLYPMCKKFDVYKMNNKKKWWLSYL